MCVSHLARYHNATSPWDRLRIDYFRRLPIFPFWHTHSIEMKHQFRLHYMDVLSQAAYRFVQESMWHFQCHVFLRRAFGLWQIVLLTQNEGVYLSSVDPKRIFSLTTMLKVCTCDWAAFVCLCWSAVQDFCFWVFVEGEVTTASSCVLEPFDQSWFDAAWFAVE
jgi:hypothetical protein